MIHILPLHSRDTDVVRLLRFEPESVTSGYRCESTSNVLTIASKANCFNCITVKWSLVVHPLADKRAVLLIVDGMADRPLIDHDYKTPLEFANTPNMDRLAKGGLVGQL